MTPRQASHQFPQNLCSRRFETSVTCWGTRSASGAFTWATRGLPDSWVTHFENVHSINLHVDYEHIVSCVLAIIHLGVDWYAPRFSKNITKETNKQNHGPGWCGSVGWNIVPCSKRLQVRFPVRAHAWVVGQVPTCGHVRGNHTLTFLSPSSCLPSPISKNK